MEFYLKQTPSNTSSESDDRASNEVEIKEQSDVSPDHRKYFARFQMRAVLFNETLCMSINISTGTKSFKNSWYKINILWNE